MANIPTTCRGLSVLVIHACISSVIATRVIVLGVISSKSLVASFSAALGVVVGLTAETYKVPSNQKCYGQQHGQHLQIQIILSYPAFKNK